MGDRLARLTVRQPLLVLAVALVVCAAVVPLVLRLRLDTDLINLVPGSSPAATAFVRYTRTFVGEQPLFVVVECDDPQKLTDFADRYAEALRKSGDFREVRVRLSGATAHLLTEHLFDLLDDQEIAELAARTTPAALEARARRIRGLLAAPGGSSLGPLLTNDPLELSAIAGPRLRAGIPVDTASGYFRSADGKAVLVFAQPKADPFDVEADRKLVDNATRIARSLGADVVSDFPPPGPTPTVGFTGTYAHTFVYRDWLHRDMEVSTVVSAVAVLLFFAVLLGALRALPIVAVPLHVGLWLTGAAAGLLYGHVNAVSLAFGTILFAIGIDLPIQIYNRLREELAARPPERAKEALEHTISVLAGPSVLATLGPALVFFACGLSDYPGLRELGVLAGTGLVLNFLAMMTVLPSLLAAIPSRLWAPRRRAPPSGSWFAAFGRLTARWPKRVLFLVLACALAAAPFARRLGFEQHLISSVEPQDIPAAKVNRELERRFGERRQALILMQQAKDPEKALDEAEALREDLERLRAQGLLSGYESITSLVPPIAAQQERRARLRALDPKRIADELQKDLDAVGLDASAFAPALERLRTAGTHPPLTLADLGGELAFLVRAHVHDDKSGRLVATYASPTPGREAEAEAALEKVAAARGAELTGLPILEAALRRVVERDTLRVTVASVIAIIALLLLYYRRWRPALAVVGPLSFAWLLFAAALGALGIPLNLFNLLAVPLVVGYGIDDHVFLVHRFAEDPSAGPARALASTGRAIVVTSLSTMAGFAGLAAARFDGLRMLGISGSLAVGLCLLAAMAVLPALLALLRPSLRSRKAPPPSA